MPLDKSDIAVSHRVGKSTPGKPPRQIIARITNYEVKHQLLKSNKALRMRVEDKEKPPLPKFKNVSINLFFFFLLLPGYVPPS